MKPSTIPIALFALALWCGTAFGQESGPTITLNVPLQLQSLHQDVLEVEVAANCYDQSGAPLALAAHSVPLRPDANGNINQTVTVVLQAMAGKDITNAKTYAASLELKVKGSTVFTTPRYGNDAPIALRSKTGTPFVSQVSGNITW